MGSFRNRLTDGVPAALLACAIVGIGMLTAGPGDTTVLAICREVVAGSDQGRQALVGSCWFSPLVTVVVLPFVWLLGEAPLAGCAAAWVAWTFALVICGRILERSWLGIPLMILVGCGITAVGGGASPAMAVPAALAVFALRSAALWSRDQRLRDLVRLGAGLSGLILCGMPVLGVTLALALAVPFGALAGADTRRRLPAVLILGWLPMLYAFGVWVLMNRLIFGSSLFFVASLGSSRVLHWCGAQWLPVRPEEIAATAAAAYALASGLLTGNRRAAALGMLGLLFWVWLVILRGGSAAWADAAGRAVLLVTGALALWHLRHGGAVGRTPWVTAGDVALFGVVAVIGARCLVPPVANPAAVIAAQVDADVRARSPHARVFVCGYTGLELLSGPASERLEPNLDLYVQTLRTAYHGQHLFLLVPAPVGAAAAENVHIRHPELYTSGGGRMLIFRNYGPWRLFEVVGAPTERELDAWRSVTRQNSPGPARAD
jgi:hypothetical protein